jgi:PilZ domain-containing protein
MLGPVGRRREPRVARVLPVRMWGMDAQGRPFSVQVQTLDLSRMGGRLGGVTQPLQPGDIIGIQCGTEKARFRVAWAGAPGTPAAGQVGVCCVEPAKYIWGVLVPDPARDTYEPRPAGAPTPLPTVEQVKSRRAAKRLRCVAGALVENVQDKVRLWAECTDISRHGCYVETWHPFQVGTQVRLALTFHELRVQASAVVKTVHPALGMGLSLTAVDAENVGRLEQIVARLEGMEQAPAEVVAQDELSGRLQSFAEQLRELESHLVTSTVDARMLREFRNALDHARQTAWAVEQFLELQQQKRDPFQVLSLVTLQRIHSTIRLCRELVTDIEATDVSFQTEGLTELHDSVRALLLHLDKMFAKPSAA